jgi:hypothetical protein
VSLLRVTCEGDDVGAEVTLNGKFKGECPVDIQAGSGTVKLRVVKKVGATHERVFEREYRMGDGGMQRAEAILGPAQPSAEGLRIEAGRLATERVQAASRKQVRDVALAAGLIPPRPQIPLEISEDIWQIIEVSEAYRNLPRQSLTKIGYQKSDQVEYTGSKYASLPRPKATKTEATQVSTPLGDKCAVTRIDSTEDGIRSNGRVSYFCGVYLGSTLDGKSEQFIKSIDELKGSLFPIRIGNRTSVRYRIAYMPNPEFDSTYASSCEVTGQRLAGEVDPRLTGGAWKVRCLGSNNINGKTYKNEFDDYYLEDLGILLSAIGVSDQRTFVLPKAGSQTLFKYDDEPESSFTKTTTYGRYDWSVGK